MKFRSDVGEITLADALEFVVDNRGKSVPTSETGMPLIATNCINNSNLYPSKEKLRYVSQETFDNWFRSHPKPGDIILTNKGSQNGAVCLVPDPVGFCIAQDMVALRANPKKIVPSYLFSALRSDLVQNRIKNLNVDAVIPHFKKTDFNKLLIPLPSTPEQVYIGNSYLNISQKIELNCQINQTLEQMARVIFKSWFVDFDPVHAKVQAIKEGRDPIEASAKVIGNPALEQTGASLREIAALFPSEFEESELGLVPKGWRVCQLDSIANVIDPHPSHRAPKAVDEGYPFAGIGDVDAMGNINTAKARIVSEDPVSEQEACYSITDKTTGFGRVGTVGKVVRLRPQRFRYALSPTLAVINPLKTEYAELVHYLMKSEKFQNQVFSQMTGRTRPAIGIKVFRKLTLVIPAPDDEKVVGLFNDIVGEMVVNGDSNNRQSQSLIGVRDLLLPKLLSGKIRVGEAEQQIAGVV